MNPGQGTSWPDLHYAETEQVEFNVREIIARGTRLRRRRLITRVAAAVVLGIAPVVVVVNKATSVAPIHPITAHALRNGPRLLPVLGTRTGPPEPAHVKAPAAQPVPGAGGQVKRPVFGTYNGPMADQAAAAPDDSGYAGDDLLLSLAQASVRRAVTLSRKYGPLLAMAGARGSSGIWFTATAAQLTLFHMSMAGALRSWSLPAAASSVSAGAGVGLAVTTAGLAWVGVGSTLVSVNTKNSQVSTWQVPVGQASGARGDAGGHKSAWPGYSLADSVAVSPGGQVAVATPHSSSVQVLDPRDGTFRPVRLPDAADQPLAVGYARDGTLGVGYRQLGRPDSGAVLLVSPAGKERSTPVAQPTAVTAYGTSAVLVGVTKLVVVSSRGQRPLLLPADSPDFAGVTTPPAPLPGGRLGIAMDTAILTFPATATSATIATKQSELWVTKSPRCRPHHRCPAGYQLVATDEAGDMWVVPKADRRTVELVSLG